VDKFTPPPAGLRRAIDVALLETFAELAAKRPGGGRYATREGLMWLRGRVDPQCREFDPGPELDDVRRVIAAALGIEPGDMPDSEPVPDFAPRWYRDHVSSRTVAVIPPAGAHQVMPVRRGSHTADGIGPGHRSGPGHGPRGGRSAGGADYWHDAERPSYRAPGRE
jgi:hypothetical protein